MNKLTRDTNKGWLTGMFAGLCGYLGLSLFWCRVVFIAFAMFEPITATLVYAVAAFLMPKRKCRSYY
ncbi:PspC domain-containing protein [Ferrimonas aestuarii]|uniref:PspC domain-containing protein n=1 Tax=Ferrimonas aestuarii TaxID=2569539 RepID=A0A4U1BT68_9GAMM|nr:PspC domain-containing protein [Ferrimonas aestuarii]TKB56817.1 PspC domain-containing protein [Ferrimonas aestuarii]